MSTVTLQGAKARKPESQFTAVMKRLRKNHAAVAGLIVFIMLIILAVIGPWIAPYDYSRLDFSCAFAKPSAEHLFGCDELGRDIFSRVLYGARYSLTIGVGAVALCLVIGLVLGSVAGFFGGKVDNLLMRFLDIFQSIPGMLMSIAISAVLGRGLDKCILAISLTSMPQYVRILRASILGIRDNEYVEAAESINCSRWRIITRHVLPNALSGLIVTATMGIANSIILAAGLSYVGLGVQPPTPEWGARLSGARNYIRDYPHMVIFPGLAIAVTVLSLNMMGDGLRDALDPKLKR